MPSSARQKILVTLVAALCLLIQGNMHGASAEPVPGGTLDPLIIPKYVTPLVIPPVMPKSTIQPGAPAADYNIAVRQFRQQILPGGIWNSINGRSDNFGATTVWSYGRAEDAIPGGFTAPVPLSSNITFNYPAFTVENSSGVMTKVRWINDLVNPVTKEFLPHLLQVDQTLHWANPAAIGCTDSPTNRTDCRTINPAPYRGPVPIVTHVHGAHVNPQSDGYPEAWWLPAASNIPAGYARHGSYFYQYNNSNTVPGSAFFAYENTQPAATLWYHDHALGMTRNNVYAGPAGFWLIRGGINGDEEVRDTAGQTAKLPAPSALAAGGDPNFSADIRAKIREIPLAIQDRSFNSDGSLFYPSNRAFFEGLNVPGQAAQFPGTGVLDIPLIPNADISPIWNPEAFFNTIVVNGTTWPILEVAPATYRFRLLNGCNSRTLNLALFQIENNGLSGELSFFQIGAEQGFLPKVVMIKTGFATVLPGNGTIPAENQLTPQSSREGALLMAPAERVDVLVDFSGLPDGTVVRMINTAPDAPFGSFPDTPADPGTTGQVMQFVIKNSLLQSSDALTTQPENIVLPAEARLGAATATRQLTLNEEVSNQVCVQDVNGSLVAIPSVPFDPNNPEVFMANCNAAGGIPMGPKAAQLGILINNIATGSLMSVPKMWMEPVTENPFLNSTEEWEIYNTTVDAHPIHLHLVRFEVINRQEFDSTGFAPIPGTVTEPAPNELGYKDTVVAPPGHITRIRARFDIPGRYVWHCHIVEHEDNEMMRPYNVIYNPQFPDFTQDGKVDTADYSVLLAEIRKTTPRNPAFDLNRDGKVDLLDAKFFYNIMQGI